jgi:hypothetical protein
MALTYSIDRTRRRLMTSAEGLVTYPDLVSHLERAFQENTIDFAELFDATRATPAILTSELRRVVRHLWKLASQSAVGPAAVVVADDLSFGLVRMLGILMEDVCAVRPFRSLAEAEAWLDGLAASRQPGGSA